MDDDFIQELMDMFGLPLEEIEEICNDVDMELEDLI